MSESPVVTVEQGQLQGRIASSPTGKAFYSFQGIPYAKPPLGSLRFKAPQPPEPWDGIRDATSEGSISAQIDFFGTKQYTGDENCLFLNVYTPNLDGAFLPVMVFIHGGGFKLGSGNSNLYGADYLVEKDVIIVTLNYRCGPLGFLSLNTPEVPGNAGIKDIVQAIRWVKNNIENFGGNSGNITIFGESAGGMAVSLLTASPLTKSLISKAIIQSGTALSSFVYQKNPIENAKNLAQILGCESGDPEEILEFLNATSAKELVEAHEKLSPMDEFPEKMNPFGIVIEKEFPGVEAVITEAFIDLLTSGRVSETPIMIGSTTLEFAFERKTDDLQLFIPEELKIERNSTESLAIVEKLKKLYFKGSHTGVESLHEYWQLLSDFVINVDTHRYVQYLVQATNKPIYYYKFDYVGELNISNKVLNSLGLKHPMHMDELGYLFKNDYQKDVEPSAQDVKMRERMLRLWTNFAKSGNPTPDENHYITVTWLPVTKDNQYFLNLGQELSLSTSPDKEKMEFWDDLYSKHFRIWEHPKTNTETSPIKYDPPVIVDSVSESVTIYSSSEVTESSHIITETITSEVFESNNSIESHNVIESNNVIESSVTEVDDVVDEPIIVEQPLEPISSPKVEEPTPILTPKIEHEEPVSIGYNNHVNGKARTSNEIKMVTNANGAPKDVIRANDPPEDDLPKNIGVNKFVNFFESLGGKK
ncbi:juvenile hormone esterase-like isoform X2 [Anticarsia gemmatalis]